MIAALGLAVAVTIAQADAAPPGVVVVSVCDDEPALTQTASRVAAALATRGWKVGVLPAPGTPARRCLTAERRQAQTAIEEGRALFEGKLRHDAARLRLEEGLAAFTASEAMLDPDLYAVAHFYLAWIALETSQPAVAESHFAAVHAATPSWAPGKKPFPPHVIQGYQAARHRLRAQRAAVAVQTEPSDAAVSVDGNARCRTPCNVGELPPGEHFFEVRKAGLATVRKRLVLAPGAREELRVTLEPDQRDVLARSVELGTDATTASLAFGKGAVVAMASTSGGIVGVLSMPGFESRRVLMAGAQASAREAELVAMVGEPPPVRGPTSPPVAGVTEPSFVSTLPQRWWFWAAVAGVAAGTVGLAVSASRDDVRMTLRP